MTVFLKCFTHTLLVPVGTIITCTGRHDEEIQGISKNARMTAAYEKYSKEDWSVVLESWRWSLRPSSTPGRVGVVLGAQFYTRQVGRIWSEMITAARGDEHRQRLLGAAIQRQLLLGASSQRRKHQLKE